MPCYDIYAVRLMIARYGIFLLVVLLGACSGSSSTDDSTAGTASEPDTTLVEPPALNLHLRITERSGKRVVDGYFSRTDDVAVNSKPVWSDGKNSCIRLPDIDPEMPVSSRTQWPLERAARRIDISTREGHYVSLIPQQAGNTIVYAADERWVSAPLPDDAVLQVIGTDDVRAIGVALSPLPPLQRLSSENGRLAGTDKALRWQMPASSDDRIELRLSAVGASKDESVSPSLVVVECMLADDGFFEVPDALLLMLGEPRYVNIGIARYRQRRVSMEGGYLSVVHRSVN